jgi:hypothetical protein
MLEIEGSAEKVLEKLIRNGIPKRLDLPIVDKNEGWCVFLPKSATHNNRKKATYNNIKEATHNSRKKATANIESDSGCLIRMTQ